MNDLAFMGLEILKRSALRALYELGKNTDWVRQDRVRERLGIPKVDFGNQARHNSLIYGVLYHLKEDGYADHLSAFGWRITELGKKSLGEQVNA